MGRVYNKDKHKVSNDDGAEATDISESSDSEHDNEQNDEGGGCEKCTDPHDGKLIMQKQFPYNIDELFTMMFTNCKFNMNMRRERHVSDYEEIPWQTENGLKRRKMTYTLALSSVPMGPKETHVTEIHVMNKCSKPGALYSIDSTSENAGIPYADYFTVAVHYCLQRVTRSSTILSFYGQIKYKKSTMFKSFIEKNAIIGLQEFCTALEAKLNAKSKPTRKSREHRPRSVSSAQKTESEPAPAPPPGPSFLRWLLVLVLVLLAANALLYWRLRYGERSASLNDLQSRLYSIQSAQSAEWSRLLEQHSARQREQIGRWREALHTTVQHLAQTEQTLTKLLETIKPSLDNALREAEGYIRTGEL